MRTAPTLLLLSLSVALSLLCGCEDQHVGRMCFIQRDIGGAENVVVNSSALECPSRLCLHYPNETGAAPASLDLCTAECSSDEDCEGETSSLVGHCKDGFKCAWPVQVGTLCCKPMCVCRDLIIVPDGGTISKPSACEPTNANRSICPNL